MLKEYRCEGYVELTRNPGLAAQKLICGAFYGHYRTLPVEWRTARSESPIESPSFSPESPREPEAKPEAALPSNNQTNPNTGLAYARVTVRFLQTPCVSTPASPRMGVTRTVTRHVTRSKGGLAHAGVPRGILFSSRKLSYTCAYTRACQQMSAFPLACAWAFHCSFLLTSFPLTHTGVPLPHALPRLLPCCGTHYPEPKRQKTPKSHP